MATYPTYGSDPGWLGTPKYRPPSGLPQFGGPGFGTPQTGASAGYGQYSRPMFTGATNGSYSNPGINDPTLAASYGGYGGSGGQASGGGLPPGALTPPIQYGSGGLPPWMKSQGWSVGVGPNGGPIWLPPGSSSAPTGHYHAL